jgi:hypothetical protein
MTTLLLPPAAWRVTDGIAAASFRAPGAGGVAVLALGWPEASAARLLSPDAPPQPFRVLGDVAFAAVAAVAEGAAVTIEAPAPPLECRVVFVPRPAASPSLALLAPRAIRAPRHPAPHDLDAARSRLDMALAAQEIDTALGVVAEMLVVARAAGATRQAVLDVLAHLARYPLARSPALGAFVAALTE